MTDEFKKILINYLTGNLSKETGEEQQIIRELENLDYQEFRKFFLEAQTSLINVEDIIQNNITGKTLIYGGVEYQDDTVGGYIFILDEEFKPYKWINKYQNGENLKYVQTMNIDYVNNRYYAVTSDSFPNRTTEYTPKQMVILNDITNTEIIKLNEYTLPENNFYAKNIYKSPNNEFYVMCGLAIKEDENPSYNKLKNITLKINEGTANEFKTYNDDNQGWLYGASYVEFDENDNFYCNVIITKTFLSNRTVNNWIKNFESENFNLESMIVVEDYTPYVDTASFKNQAVFLNKNEVYFVTTNQNWGIQERIEKKYIELNYFNFITRERKILISEYLGDYDFVIKRIIQLNANQNKLYILNTDNITDSGSSSYLNADISIQRYNDKIDLITLFTQVPIRVENNFFTQNNFNLVNCIYMFDRFINADYWKSFKTTEVYNEFNYNGLPYENTNSLIPESVELYNVENKLIFNRNLYNKVVTQNSTQASVEIPTTYLNNEIIEKETLIGETKVDLINNNLTIQKNIFENLVINFYDSILIKNRNDPTNELINLLASSRLNYSVSDIIDYENTKIEKARVKYTDNTESIQNIDVEKTSNTTANIKIGIAVPNDKTINKIEILSNDEQTIYQEITNLNLESGKTYSVIQEVKII